MFGVQKYFNMLVNTKWYFPEHQQKDLEDLLYVDFDKKEDYFVLKKIRYTVMDILLALEDMDIEIKKNGDEVKLKILKV